MTIVPALLPRDSKARDHLLSGAASGLASSVILQPLDLLKTRIQQQGDSSRSAHFLDSRRLRSAESKEGRRELMMRLVLLLGVCLT
jgi:hypothetical protein